MLLVDIADFIAQLELNLHAPDASKGNSLLAALEETLFGRGCDEVGKFGPKIVRVGAEEVLEFHEVVNGTLLFPPGDGPELCYNFLGSNLLDCALLMRGQLAEGDGLEVAKEREECFCDFVAVAEKVLVLLALVLLCKRICITLQQI